MEKTSAILAIQTQEQFLKAAIRRNNEALRELLENEIFLAEHWGISKETVDGFETILNASTRLANAMGINDSNARQHVTVSSEQAMTKLVNVARKNPLRDTGNITLGTERAVYFHKGCDR